MRLSFYDQIMKTLSKPYHRIFKSISAPIIGQDFDNKKICIALFCDPQESGSSHIEKAIRELTKEHNIVLFIPNTQNNTQNYQEYCWKTFCYDKAKLANNLSVFINELIQLPLLKTVLIDQTIDYHFVKKLWQKSIASLMFLNNQRIDNQKNLNKVLAYTTTAIYDSKDTFFSVLNDHLWAYPDEFIVLSADTLNKAHQISDIAKQAASQIERQDQDSHYLAKHQGFDFRYWSGKSKGRLAHLHMARTYIRNYKSGTSAARPCSGFHPGIYAQHHDLGYDRTDPFVHYLQNNKPKGTWCWDVITKTISTPPKTNNAKIALHIHAYYPDMLRSILVDLQRNIIRPDLFISIKDAKDEAEVREHLAHYQGHYSIKTVPNRGRDIGPLLTEFGRELIKNYDIIGHIHTKKSLHISKRTRVDKWNNFLTSNLIGNGTHKTADTIIEYMVNHPKTGLIFPDDKYAVSWARNYFSALPIAKKMGLAPLPHFTVFPVGTMFWARTQALKAFIDLDLQWSDYPAEPLPNDGTMLHGIERLFALNCFHHGLDIATTYLPNIER